MKKTEGQIIAQEVWNMLTDNAKKEMKGLKKSFMESVAADVDAIVNKNFVLADVSSLLKAEREATKEEIPEWLRDLDFEGLAERL
jgi:hypothetical protein